MNHSYESLRSRLLPGEHNDPVPDQVIHHHVKYGGRECITLGEPSVAFEWGTVIATLLIHHEEVISIDPEDPLCPWHNTVAD